MSAYHQALVDRDLESLREIVDDEAIYLFSNGKCMIGRTEVLAGIKANFNAIEDESYEINDIRWLVQQANAAICVYAYRWSGKIQGEMMSGGGRGTNVFHKGVDGCWKVVHEHLSQGSLGSTTRG